MKKSIRPVLALSVLLIAGVFAMRLFAADGKAPGAYEYATLRWSGRDNMHVVRPDGHVEFIGLELRKTAKPEKVDDRAFYMNLAMNSLAKEGYEFAGISSDDIIMRKAR